ncbi:hypothetical protein [Aliikangiella sp. G2MR2-5]|uniref:hypothetical protein n=1 Tax=Aliikangiella sp. G2MR2-5 TaxID=2788943 RepID=UPI0018A9F9AF|nr:hypothetical protein [Aliikangiella sp. G2MR2-5]
MSQTDKTTMIKRLSLYLLGLIITFLLIVKAINLSIFDEQPSEGVTQVMKPYQMPPASQNAYFYLFGMQSAASRDPHSTGQRLEERYRHNRDNLGKDELSDDDYNEILGATGLDKEWTERFERCRSRTEEGCLQKILTQLDDLNFEAPRLSLMLERYQTLIKFRDYSFPNGFTFYSPLPGYAAPMSLQQLTLAKAFQSGLSTRFISAVDKDLRFWRMILDKGSSLIDKMVAIAAIWNDLKYLSDFMNLRELNDSDKEQLANILTGLSAQEKDISEAFILEAASMYRQLENISDEELESFFESSNWLMNQLIQINATNNDHYRLFLAPILELSKLDSQAFYKSLPEGSSKFEDRVKLSLSPSNLYNLGGKLLLQNSGWMASDYIARVHDLNGMFALVSLQLSLDGLSDDSIASTINSSQYRNPYTGKPFTYNETTKELGFECMNKESSCKIKLSH